MDKATNTLASSSFVAGLILGIYLLTGTSIDPVDLLGMVARAIVGQLSPQYSALLGVFLGVLTIVGIVQTIFLIVSGIRYRIKGLVMTSCCFFGGLILVFNPLTFVAIILICIGYIIANFFITP